MKNGTKAGKSPDNRGSTAESNTFTIVDNWKGSLQIYCIKTMKRTMLLIKRNN